MDIILASASERRIELLKKAGIDFQVIPADIREEILPEEKPDDLPQITGFGSPGPPEQDAPDAKKSGAK